MSNSKAVNFKLIYIFGGCQPALTQLRRTVTAKLLFIALRTGVVTNTERQHRQLDEY